MQEIFNSLRKGLDEIKDINLRIEYLKKLRLAITNNIDELSKALKEDFNKPEYEVLSTEVFGVLNEIDVFIKKIKKWSKTKKVGTSFLNFPAKGYVYKEPIGVVYISSPWNYPFNLTMTPLIGAIASGNTVIVRPSGTTANTASVINKICSETFPQNIVYVALGGHDIADKILELDLDMVFFTGSFNVGKMIYEKAASHLARVVLELGGKSPAIVLKDANLEMAAKRLVWAKFLNGGQTCVAPDYLIIDESVKNQFLALVKKYIDKFYYVDGKITNDFPHIINKKNFERIKGYLTGDIFYGGEYDDEKLLIYPTIINNININMPIMQEEIFGPILPVLSFCDEKEIYSLIEKNSNPLAIYVFSKNKKTAQNILKNIRFGGGCINDAIMHLTNEKLPFGGIKTSGLGSYHGYESFKIFTHFKSVMFKSPSKEINSKYPPYNNKKISLLKKVGRIK